MTDITIETYRDWTIVYNHESEQFHAVRGARRLKPGKADNVYRDNGVKSAKERVDGDILAKKRKKARDGKPELEFRRWKDDLSISSTLVNYTNRGFKTTDGIMEIRYGERTLLVIPKLFSTGRLHTAVSDLRLAKAEMDAALKEATTPVVIPDGRGASPEGYAEIEDQIRKNIEDAS